MKKILILGLFGLFISALYFGGTSSKSPSQDQFRIPFLTSICEPSQQAWKIPYSLDLPPVDQIEGFPDMDKVKEFLQDKADDLSWRSFIALNWPATKKGTADSTACLTTTTGRAVWEYWMPSTEIYVEPGDEPNEWDIGTSFWYRRPKNGGRISEMRLMGKSPEHMTILNAEEYPVISDEKNYTLYEIFYNKPAYDYVVKSGLYSKAGQASFTREWPSHTQGLVYTQNDDTVNIEKRFKRAYFPIGNIKDSTIKNASDGSTYYFSIGEGAIIVKSAWIKLSAKDDFSQFHTREVKLPNGDKIMIGLVAMHLIHKVAEATQWVWSTFEHVRCAPVLGPDGLAILEPGVDYLYFDESENNPANYNIEPSAQFQPIEGQRQPTQVVKLMAPMASSQKINDMYHELIRKENPESVWLNYRLAGTQWPFDPELFTSGGNYQPTKLANSLMETYRQKTSTCMGCHSHAKFGEISGRENPQYNADFIFGLSGAR